MSLTASALRAPLLLVRLASATSIFEQLCLEEALLRTDTRNWCALPNRLKSGQYVGRGKAERSAAAVSVRRFLKALVVSLTKFPAFERLALVQVLDAPRL